MFSQSRLGGRVFIGIEKMVRQHQEEINSFQTGRHCAETSAVVMGVLARIQIFKYY